MAIMADVLSLLSCPVRRTKRPRDGWPVCLWWHRGRQDHAHQFSKQNQHSYFVQICRKTWSQNGLNAGVLYGLHMLLFLHWHEPKPQQYMKIYQSNLISLKYSDSDHFSPFEKIENCFILFLFDCNGGFLFFCNTSTISVKGGGGVTYGYIKWEYA